MFLSYLWCRNSYLQHDHFWIFSSDGTILLYPSAPGHHLPFAHQMDLLAGRHRGVRPGALHERGGLGGCDGLQRAARDADRPPKCRGKDGPKKWKKNWNMTEILWILYEIIWHSMTWIDLQQIVSVIFKFNGVSQWTVESDVSTYI